MEKTTVSEDFSTARSELSGHWGAVQRQDNDGIKFGECCLKWERSLGSKELYKLYRELGIAPSVANWWKIRFLQKEGLLIAKKERRNNRASNTFDGVLDTALKFVRIGFEQELAKKPDDANRLRLAKDWAFAKLNSPY